MIVTTATPSATVPEVSARGSSRPGGSAAVSAGSSRAFERTLRDAQGGDHRSDAGSRRSDDSVRDSAKEAPATTTRPAAAGPTTGAPSGEDTTTAASADGQPEDAVVVATPTPAGSPVAAVVPAALIAAASTVAGTPATTESALGSSGTVRTATATVSTAATGTATVGTPAVGAVAAAEAAAASASGQPVSPAVSVTAEGGQPPAPGGTVTAPDAAVDARATAGSSMPMSAGATGASGRPTDLSITVGTTTHAVSVIAGRAGDSSTAPVVTTDTPPAANAVPGAAGAAPTAAAPAVTSTPAAAPANAIPAWMQQAVHAQLTGRLVAAARGRDAGSVQQLTLHLHPADLGAVQVIATLDDGTVSLQLLAGNPATREALRAALATLRSDLVAAGLDGTRLDVSDQPPSQQPAPQQQFGASGDGSPRAFAGAAAHGELRGGDHRGDRPSATAGARHAPPGRGQGVDLRL